MNSPHQQPQTPVMHSQHQQSQTPIMKSTSAATNICHE